MKKAIAVSVLLLIAGVRTQTSAGWTDLWCVGGASTQICINQDGYIVPATGNQNLGSVSYPFSILHLKTLTAQTGLTVPTATISGALYLGAVATRSTHTAAGALAVHGALSAATLNTGQGANELYAMDQAVQTSDSPIFNGIYLGAIATRSTHTAAGVLNVHNAVNAGGAVGAGTTLTAGTNIIATAGYIQLYSRSKAQILAITPTAVGQEYYCNDCTTAVVCRSTGTVQYDFAGADRTAICD